MRQPKLNIKPARGFLLIVAVLVLVVVALAIAAMGSMTSSDISASSGQAQSDQAYFVAESGLEAATHAFANGTGCASLTFPGGVIPSTQVGSGTFTTSGTLYPTAFTATLQASIANNSLISQIPLSFTVGSIANLAPHGEILIDSEFITYSGSSNSAATCSPVAAPCLTGTQRATNGSTIASHAAGAVVTQQSQCVIRSVGNVQSATRVAESTLALKSGGASSLFNGSSIALPNGATTSLTGGAWSPGLPAGDNYVIAIVTFSDTSAAGLSSIPSGNLQIVATNPAANPLAATTSIVTFGNGSVPSKNVFPQETQVLLARHPGALAAATYNLQVVNPTTYASSARAQILVISGINAANASIASSAGNVAVNTAATLIVNSANTLPAGDNIVIAQLQLDSFTGKTPVIAANNLALRRGAGTGGAVLMSNRFDISSGKNNTATQGTGYLLLALDPGAAAGTQYSVTALADVTGLNASSTILAFNGSSASVQPPIASQPPASVIFGTTATSLGSVADPYSAGERIALAGIQYRNTSGGTRNIAAGSETITLNGSPVSAPPSANAYNWTMCNSGTAVECADFFSGLLWRGSSVAATPSFGVQSQADGANMTGAANILAIKLGGGGVRQIDSMEVYP